MVAVNKSRPKRRDHSQTIAVIAGLITIIMLLSAYSISTKLVFPFGKTSAHYLVPNINEHIPAKMISVPIEIHVIESEISKVGYSDNNLVEILDHARIVRGTNANITFNLRGINHVDVPAERAEPSKSLEALEKIGNDFLRSKLNDGVIDIIIVKSFENDDLGGIAHPRLTAVMISAFEDQNWAKWNLAHELGHLLNLFDVFQMDNLMQADEYPWNIVYKKEHLPQGLTREQVLTARDWAYKVYCSDESCIKNSW